MRTIATQTIYTSILVGFLFLALLVPQTGRAATESEEFDRMAVQLNAIQSVVSFMSEHQSAVLGASTNRIAELRAKIAVFTSQISDLTAQRSATEKELAALVNAGGSAGSGGGGGSGGILPVPRNNDTTCTLTSTQREYKLGDIARFTWTTKNATVVSFVPDTSGKDNLVPPSGSQQLSGTVDIPVTVLGAPFITLSAAGGKTVTCKAIITVTQADKGGKKAEYKGYFAPSNTPFIISKKETKAEALANCALNTNSNPTKKVWCTWDGAVIMGVKPGPTTPTPPQPPTPTTPTSTPGTVGILESVSVSETTIVNNMSDRSDDQARFEIKFDVIAHDSDMFIPKTAARGTTGTAGALVTIENGQGAVVTTGTMSSVLTSTADSEGASYRVNEGETETFTVTVTFDPTTIGGSYRMQLQGITWTAGGNGGMTSTAATPAADFETGVLII